MSKIGNFLKKESIFVILILLEFIISICFYPSLPEKMPIHWNTQGQVDGYGSKFFGAFGIPLICLGLYFFYVVIPYVDPKRKNYKNFRLTYQLFKYIIIIFFLCFHTIILLNVTGVKINISSFINVAISVLFIVLGNAMGRIKHNYFIGVRTLWTLASEEVWNKTHRLAAPIWVVGGISNLILFLLGVEPYSSIAITIIIAVIPMIYSYVLYKKIVGDK